MKKILFMVTIVLAIGMITSSFAQTKVLSGYWGASKTVEGYTLADNSGDRSVTITVNFLEPFENKPEVTLAVTLLDATAEKNVRYKVEALSVSRDAMTIKISTWADTKIFGISGYWLAHGE
ncbi:MAG: H-type lectin domain-containing protein [Ignavibacteriaceae bacterium]|nr:H-type lectin domain-containing protein [Ignavibacteriaceae bacterium]